MKRILVLAMASLACGKSQSPVGDAAVERFAVEASVPTSDVPPTLAVDFSVEGCPSFDADKLSCTGAAPLTLRFVPLVTTVVSQYLWNFGENQSAYDSGPTPIHVYAAPGQYTVKLLVNSLNGAPLNKTHEAFVTVTANQIGEPCDLDAQCANKLTCLCPSSSPCSFGPGHGSCAALCQAGANGCGDGQVCAGLSTQTKPGGLRETWQSSLCLRACTDDSDCSAPLHCRLLPPGPGSTEWGRACFGNWPVDIGQPCMDLAGALRDDLCASGTCADLGAKGLCTMACSTASCAPGSECAELGDGRRLCLRPCSEGFTCTDDPLLGCVAPGNGDLGYRLIAAPTAPGYCAPRPCASDDDCLPAGLCDSETGGHCVPRK
jgi:PKD repeat protein